MDRNFAVFILSHGRAGKVYTFDTLRKQGYTGKIYIIIDNEDEQEAEYKKRFKNVIVFDKKKYAEITDTADNLTARNVVVFARNACWDIAEKIGLTHFLVLDDDYTNFEYRYPEGEKLKTKKMMKLDGAFEKVLDFLDVSGAVTVALAQGGDFIGGVNNKLFKEGVARKAMNSFFVALIGHSNFMDGSMKIRPRILSMGIEDSCFLPWRIYRYTRSRHNRIAVGLRKCT